MIFHVFFSNIPKNIVSLQPHTLKSYKDGNSQEHEANKEQSLDHLSLTAVYGFNIRFLSKASRCFLIT